MQKREQADFGEPGRKEQHEVRLARCRFLDESFPHSVGRQTDSSRGGTWGHATAFQQGCCRVTVVMKGNAGVQAFLTSSQNRFSAGVDA